MREEWESFYLDSDLTIPADAFQLVPSGFGPEYFSDASPGDLVEISVNDELVLTGYLDDFDGVRDKRTRRAVLQGRDKASLLVDCCPEPLTMKNVDLVQFAGNLFGDLYHDFLVHSEGPALTPFKEVQVSPGQTYWDVLSYYAEKQDIGIWLDPNGDLVIGQPQAELKYWLFDSSDPGQAIKNNVLRLTVRESMAERFSTVVVLVHAQGNSFFHGEDATEIRGVANDPELADLYPPRILVITDYDVENTAQANTLAEKKLREGKLASFTCTAEVEGFTQDGWAWKPGDLVHVESDEFELNKDLFLLSRRFIKDRRGERTILRMGFEGAWP